MKIKYKFILSYLILIIFTISALGFLLEKKSSNAMFNEFQEKIERVAEMLNNTMSIYDELITKNVNSNLKFAELNFLDSSSNAFGKFRVDKSKTIKIHNYDLPVLYAKDKQISLDQTLINDIKDSTGAIASIFLLYDNKLIRVSTNLTIENKDAEGTYIPNTSDIYKNIVNNQSCCDKITFNNKKYIASYKPLLDENKNVIGAIGLGYDLLSDYLEKSLNNIKVGKTGYIYIIDSEGNEVVHPINKNVNLKQYDFAKEIISKKNGTIEYTHNNVHKLAYYKYFEPWDWYIVATANYDDLKSSSKSMLLTTIFIGIIISIIGILLALIMTNILIKPIHKLKAYMEIASTGDLTVKSDINSNDEIGVLSNSFNKMIGENKRLFEETKKYDKLKTDFITNISHELRTPLNIIFSTTQLFNLYVKKNETFSLDNLSKYSSNIKQNCYRLLRLINNLIDLNKIDSGFMELNLQKGNIIEVIEEITLSTSDYVQSMSRNLIFDTDTEEKFMCFDSEKLERILLNLISNAIKFTEAGDTITINLYDKDTCLIISVKDNGIGIKETKLKEIFERFKQINPLLSRTHEGSGIGLSLVKSLVEIHKGTITVNSTYNVGSEFIITLPSNLDLDNFSKLHEKNNLTFNTNIEKINIEFSDIYK